MIQVVNENDDLIGHVERSEIDYKTQIYRISAIWIKNSQGQILLAQRTLSKDKDPGMWGPAVVGTLDEGETYEGNAYKEAEEELGITGEKLVKMRKVFVDETRRCFCQWYSLVLDKSEGEFVLQLEEVERVAWVDLDWLRNDLKTNPSKYVPSMPFVIKTNEPSGTH